MNETIEKLADEGVAYFTGNSRWWKQMYDGAPEVVKRALRYEWGAHALRQKSEEDQPEPPEVATLFRLSSKIEVNEFTKNDWKYLIDHTTVPLQKIYYKEMMDKCKR